MLSETSELYDEFNFETSADNLHALVLEELTDRQKEVYTLLYIDKLDDQEVAEKMGFTPDGSKGSRSKQLNNLKKKFAAVAKTIMEDNDVIE